MDFDFSGKPTFFRYDGASYSYQSSTTLTANQWNHIAVSRNSSNTLSMWINGTRVFTGTVTTSFNNVNSNPLYIGRRVDGGVGGTHYFPGYISNARIVTGTDVYGAANSTITVPTTPLTAISGTALLTSQDNRFKDNSTNAFALTVAGNPSVQAFSPFAPTAAYDTAVVGGSGYFDGTGDYLTVANNAALQLNTGSWTIECFFYPTALGGASYKSLITKRTTATAEWEVGTDTSDFIYFWNGTTIYAGTIKPTLNSWNHLAATYDGTNLRLFVNGAVALTQASATASSGTNSVGIGASPTGSQYSTGYLSSARVVKGTAVYTAAFTPATAPLTAITNTSLLTNFTNSGIFDSTAKNVLETVGNAQVSTTQAKWGTTSISILSAGAYCKSPSSSNWGFGTGDYTVEFWMYKTTSTSYGSIISVGAGAGGLGIAISSDSSVVVTRPGTAIDFTFSAGLTLNTWYHVAICRAGTSLRCFVNGTQVGTTQTSSANYATSYLNVGIDGDSSSQQYIGYIDDLRITKYARYVANFSVPTAAFPLQ
jgi:hypothetical protein